MLLNHDGDLPNFVWITEGKEVFGIGSDPIKQREDHIAFRYDNACNPAAGNLLTYPARKQVSLHVPPGEKPSLGQVIQEIVSRPKFKEKNLFFASFLFSFIPCFVCEPCFFYAVGKLLDTPLPSQYISTTPK